MMIINYYYLSLVPFVVAFRKFPLRDIIVGRAVFSTMIESLNTEICTAPNVCLTILNSNDRDPMQLFYVATALYLVNFVWKQNAIKEDEKRLAVFEDYINGRRFANAALIIWAIVFTKSVGCAF